MSDQMHDSAPAGGEIVTLALVPVDLMQRVWMNLYYCERDAGYTFQSTLNEVVDWLAKHDALPALDSSLTADCVPQGPRA